jgi:hypothetical protein
MSEKASVGSVTWTDLTVAASSATPPARLWPCLNRQNRSGIFVQFAIARIVGADLCVCPSLGLHVTTGADLCVCPSLGLHVTTGADLCVCPSLGLHVTTGAVT